MTSARRERIGWYAYDWASSAFALTVLSVFLGPYLTTVTRQVADANGFVHPFGVPVFAGSFYSYAVSVSVMVQMLILPAVGALADHSQRKKPLLAGGAAIAPSQPPRLAVLSLAGFIALGLAVLLRVTPIRSDR